MNAQLSEAPAEHAGHGTPSPAADHPRAHRGGSSIAGRQRDDFVFTPRHSSFYQDITVTIGSHPINIAFDRTVQKCQFALYELEATAPIIAPTEESVEEIMKALDKAMNSFDAFLDNERNKAIKILEDNGKPVELPNSGFSNPKVHHLRIYSPRTKSYVDLLQDADALIALLDRMWFDGFMTEVAKKRAVFQVRVRAVSLAKAIWDLHTRSIGALRRARLEFERQKQEARDEAEKRRLEAKLKRAAEVLETVDEHHDANETTPDMGATDVELDHPEQARAAKPKRASKKAVEPAADAA